MPSPHLRRTRPRLVVSFAVAVLTSAVLGGAGDPDEKTPNSTIVEFARSRIGEQVGDGECTSLAVEAMKKAGARRFGPYGLDADYVWGEPVEKTADARPGDIVQMRDAVFKWRRRFQKNGNTIIETGSVKFPHHTAVISEVGPKGKTLKILHQNVLGVGEHESTKRTVREDLLRMNELQKGGWIKIYRPVPLDVPGDDPTEPAEKPASAPRPPGSGPGR